MSPEAPRGVPLRALYLYFRPRSTLTYTVSHETSQALDAND